MELKLSQGGLARKAGCAREQINRIENGKIKYPVKKEDTPSDKDMATSPRP